MSNTGFHIVATISGKGIGRVNEDLVGSAGNCYWLFDGATAIQDKEISGEYTSMPQWLCKEFDNCLSDYIGSHTIESVEDIYDAFDSVVRKILKDQDQFIQSLKKEEVPGMTVSFVSKTPEKILVYLIGDSPVYLFSEKEQVVRLVDERVDPYSAKTLKVMNEFRDHPDLGVLLKKVRTENRKKMNQADGYWVASLDTSWVRQGLYHEFPMSEYKGILMCSDGFDRLFSLYNICKPEDVFSESMKLKNCYKKLRQAEDEDAEMIRYPRIKKSDDASAQLICR